MHAHPETLGFWCGRLPHWEVEDGRYFVTAHLAGAIPEPAMEQIRSISEALQNGATRQTPDSCVELHRRVFAEMERWLDRAPAATELTDPAVAPMVMEAIEFRQSKERTTRGEIRVRRALTVFSRTTVDSNRCAWRSTRELADC